MANQQESEGKQNADQPELVLNLNHFRRDQLITSLIQLDTILQFNKAIPINFNYKQVVSKKIDDSIRLLLELTPVRPTQSTSEIGIFERIINGQLMLGLTRADRSNVINHLIAVKDSVLFDGLANAEIKLSLAIENRRFIDQLLDLPCREQIGLFCNPSARSVKEESGEPPSKKQRGRETLN